MKCSAEIFNCLTISKKIDKLINRITDRISLILDQLQIFVKLKDYISYKKPEFCLYLINEKIIQHIEFCNLNDFLIRLNEINDILQGSSFRKEPVQLNEIFVEAYLIYIKLN